MKIAGIIAEYNPFHRGHQHHIEQTRRLTGCDYVVVCMDGAFSQRGEACCLGMGERVEMALKGGTDAVFLLPALYAVRTADVFARGGVGILGSLGCDVLSFGSEIEDVSLLRQLAALRQHEPEAVSSGIQARLKMGMSHARARGEALGEYLKISPEKIAAPNAILGSEYIRAIGELNLDMEPVAIPRLGDYHDKNTDVPFASASAIREMMKKDRGAAAALVPDGMDGFILNAPAMHDMDDLLLHRLRSMDERAIAALPDVNEGLERRVKKCAQEAAGRAELIEGIKCKRYTHARLSRLCAHAMMDLTQALANRHPLPEWAYLLGMRASSRELLKELSVRTKLPIISSASPLFEDEVFMLESRATDLRALMCDEAMQRRAGGLYTYKFVSV